MGTTEDCRLKPGHKVDGRYQVVRKLGEGAFGAVYEAYDVQGKVKGSKALKLESINSRDQVLKIEVAVLHALQGTQHVCQMYAYGCNDRFNFMLMSLLGPSLSILRRRQTDQRFGVGTTMYVAAQCLQALRDIHSCSWLHRDVKPSNFAIGNTLEEGKRTIFILDFGLSRCYKYPDGSLRSARNKVGFRGTLRYCSINGHMGKELGRHDDLIGLLYMMIEMVKGSLPWRQLQDNKEVWKSKESHVSSLFEDLPPKLLNIYEYLHTLRYQDKPMYGMIEGALKDIIEGKGYDDDKLDWEAIVSEKEAEKETKNLRSNQKDSDVVVRGFASYLDNVGVDIEDLPKSLYKELLNK